MSSGFVQRHLGPSAAEQAQMLQRLGRRDLEQLLEQCVPAEILIDADQARQALPQECDERQALRELEQRAAANSVLRNLIGVLVHLLEHG